MATPVEALAERFHQDIFQQGEFSVADEIVAPDFTWHATDLPPRLPKGPTGVKQMAAMFRQAFPDLKITHEDVIACGDKVVIRWRMTGSHDGEYLGVTPTGRPIDVSGIGIFRVAGDKLAELWTNMDDLGLEQQIDALPTLEEVLGHLPS